MTKIDHRKTLGAIFFFLGLLQAFALVLVYFEYGLDLLLLGYTILYVIAGWKLHNNTDGSKTFGIIASLVCLPSFPIGTIIGIYGMWYFVMQQRDEL